MEAGNEQEFTDRAKAGDRSAFDQLVRLNKDKMFALTYRLTGDREAALDLMQDTFFAAFKEIGSFRREANFSSWLYRIAANKTLNYLRRKKIISYIPLAGASEPSYNMPDLASTGELNRTIQSEMNSLPPKQKLVFNLRFYEQLSFAEIASIMNKNESTVKTHYQKALNKLRDKLQDYR
jgi:RNA polymerase sigma-70 factor, ECF subfamily